MNVWKRNGTRKKAKQFFRYCFFRLELCWTLCSWHVRDRLWSQRMMIRKYFNNFINESASFSFGVLVPGADGVRFQFRHMTAFIGIKTSFQFLKIFDKTILYIDLTPKRERRHECSVFHSQKMHEQHSSIFPCFYIFRLAKQTMLDECENKERDCVNAQCKRIRWRVPAHHSRQYCLPSPRALLASSSIHRYIVKPQKFSAHAKVAKRKNQFTRIPTQAKAKAYGICLSNPKLKLARRSIRRTMLA